MAVNLFDANFYRAANADLVGLNDAQASAHFQTFGLNEGRRFSPFVDLNFYRAANADLAGLTNQQAYQQLSNFGVAEGRRFSPLVDIDFYLIVNPDVSQAYAGNRESGFKHLQTYGLDEGRSFSPFVNLDVYQIVNRDLLNLNLGDRALLQHLQLYGLQEGRRFDDFVDLTVYLTSNQDLATAFGGNRQLALQHLELYGLNEGRAFSTYYDTNFFRATNGVPATSSLTNEALFYYFEFQVQIGDHSPGRSDYGSNTLNTATPITVNANGNFILEFVGPSDRDDYYQFTLNQSAQVAIASERYGSNITLELLNRNGQVLQSGTVTDTAFGFGPTLVPGTYFIHIQAGSANTFYDIAALII